MARTRALVFGGTGVVGREVLRGLARAKIPTTFTYHASADRARALASDLSQRALAVDLADPEATRALVRCVVLGEPTDVFIHCAAVSDGPWSVVQEVNAHAAFVACDELFGSRTGEGHAVFVGALDRTQSVALPVAFAASQGALSGLTMALAKALGPRGVLVNMVALGVLDAGLSETLDPRLREDYKTFGALRRTGTPEEAARAILWVALENTYMSGRVLPVNGGI